MIKVAIVGYGNLGKGVETAISQNEDFELFAIFSNRAGQLEVSSDVKVLPTDQLEKFREEIDILLLCGGSANDVPRIAPQLLKTFNIVDSYDNHGDLLRYLKELDEIGKHNSTLAISATGWDPGLFSMMRVLCKAFLPKSETHTFWGKGVSQGHSNAVRDIAGVKQAVQYTIPKDAAISLAKQGDNCKLSNQQKHIRECFVVCDKADESRIANEIRTMPQYFEGYETILNFISEEQFNREHAGKLNHGGLIIGSGIHASGNTSRMTFELNLDSNPKFTAGIMLAYARALMKLKNQGKFGAFSVLDIPPVLLLDADRENIIKNLL